MTITGDQRHSDSLRLCVMAAIMPSNRNARDTACVTRSAAPAINLDCMSVAAMLYRRHCVRDNRNRNICVVCDMSRHFLPAVRRDNGVMTRQSAVTPPLFIHVMAF